MKTTMGKKRKRFTNPQGGFTLIELIVVLVILAILSAILLPTLNGYIDKAREKTIAAECRAAVTAAQTTLLEEAGRGAYHVSVTLDNALYAGICTLGEVPGEILSIETDSRSAVWHLSYANGLTCVYCSQPGNCAAGHTQTYTVGESGEPTPPKTNNTEYKYYLTDENGRPMEMTAKGDIVSLVDTAGYYNFGVSSGAGNVFYLSETTAGFVPGYYLFSSTANSLRGETLEESLIKIAGWNNLSQVNLDTPVQVYNYVKGVKNEMVVGNVYLVQRPQDSEPRYAVFYSRGRGHGETVITSSYDLSTNGSCWKFLT